MENIGKRIRLHRKRLNRTLDEIAEMCGFTKGLLSKIENGKTTPAVATLMKIADALGVKVADLIEDGSGEETIFTKAEEHEDSRTDFVRTDKGYSFFAFATRRQEKLMQPYLFTARKGEMQAHTFSHQGEEFIYMLSGQMRYKVGAVEYTLGPGDSVYFSSLEEHSLVPLSDEVKYLAIFADTPSDPDSN